MGLRPILVVASLVTVGSAGLLGHGHFHHNSANVVGQNRDASQSGPFWWQGPNSPFSYNAAKDKGIVPGANGGAITPQNNGNHLGHSNKVNYGHGNAVGNPHRGQSTIALAGCSGAGCGTATAVSGNTGGGYAGQSAASINAGASGTGYYWQQPGHPCANYEGPGCPTNFACVTYNLCVNGVYVSGTPATSVPAGHSVEAYGRPCGSSGLDVCCALQGLSQPTQYPQNFQPSVQSVVAQPQPPVQQSQYVKPQPAVQQQQYQPQPSVQLQQQPPQYPQPQPPAQQPQYPQPQPEAPRPVPQPQPVVVEPGRVPVQQQPSVLPVRPVGPPASTVTQQPFQPYTGPTAAPEPYPGCAAALKCVEEQFCDAEGVMVNTPVNLTPYQKEHRVPISPCTNPENNIVGFCCRDPNYQDPWPGGMMMPGTPNVVAPGPIPVPAPVPAPSFVPQPVVVEQLTCRGPETCTYSAACSTSSASSLSSCTHPQGGNGVCCAPYVPPPPPPVVPQAPPPPPTQPPLVICQAPQECVSAAECNSRSSSALNGVSSFAPCRNTLTGNQGVCCASLLPPPVQTQPPPPPPPPVTVPSTVYLPPVAQQPVQTVPLSQCGISRPVGQSKAGEAQFGELPWQTILLHRNGSLQCGATLIGDRYLATAAHCVKGQDPTAWNVRLGEYKLGASDEPEPHKEHNVAAVIVHPDFQDGSLFNDIALIVLNSDVTYEQSIGKICLPYSGETLSGNCYVSGWGREAFNGQYASTLHKTSTSLVAHSNCESLLQKSHLGKYFKLHQNFVCAGGDSNPGLCKADSGGPLTCVRSDGSHVLHGVSSWSMGCGLQDAPAVYTNIVTFSDWLSTQMHRPIQEIVSASNAAFEVQRQFQSNFGPGAGYGR